MGVFNTKRAIGAGVIMFILSCLAIAVSSSVPREANQEQTSSSSEFGYLDYVKSIFSTNAPERASPGDKIKESQIHVYNDQIVLDIENAEWASFTDTNSMDPILDKESNAIELAITSLDDVQVGDIVSYKSEISDSRIIHRVIRKGTDEQGAYLILQGDNNNREDPEKVRLENEPRVVVAIIY